MDTVSMLNKMSFYCQPILPLVYDESMSYYETLCKVVGQLNTTGDAVNKLNEGLTGEIADRQTADAALDARIKQIEEINRKLHFLKLDTIGNLLTTGVTRENLSNWIQDGDLIVMLYAPDELENSWAVATNYRCLGATGADSMQLSFYVPISITNNAGKSGADVAQEVVVISLPVGALTNQWQVRHITTTIPETNADGFVNLTATVSNALAVTCDVEPGAIVDALRNHFSSTNQFAVAVNARLSYDGKQYHSASAIVKADTSGTGNVRITFENYYNGVRAENGVSQMNTETIFLVGDVSTNAWSVETIDHKAFDFSRYEGFQFTRGANNVITANDESTPNAVYAQYHSDTSGKIYQNLPVRLIDTVNNSEYWNGVFDIKDNKHMTFTFVTSNYATASGKMAVRVIELSADANTTTWKYAEKEFTIPLSGGSAPTYVDFWGTGQSEVYDNGLKGWTVSLGTDKTFDYIFDLISSGANVVARLYMDSTKAELVSKSMEASISGDKTLGFINFLFMNAADDVAFGFTTIADAIWVTKTTAGTSAYALYKWCALPAPTGDSSDNGKVPIINGSKWELKTPAQEQLTGTTFTLTPTQVYEAISSGTPVKVQYTDNTYGLLSFTAFNVAETLNKIVSQTIVYNTGAYILAELSGNKTDNRWYFIATTLAQKTDIPSALPNPNSLTITSGSDSVTYDGSAAKSIDIPSLDDIVTETTQVLPDYTNLIPTSTDASGAILNGVGYEAGALNSDGSVSPASSFTSGFIPVKKGDVVRIKDPSSTNFSLDKAVALYKADKAISAGIRKYIRGLQDNAAYGSVTISGNVLTWDTSSISYYAWEGFKYLRVMTSSADSIVTINEEIKESTQTVMTLKPTVKVSKDNLNFAINEPMLAGRKIVVFGDSLIGMTRDSTSVTAYAASYTGATVYNVGFGGCRMSKHPTNGYAAFSMWALADAVATGDYSTQEAQAPSGQDYFASQLAVLESIDFETVDAIVIHYGTNDFNASVQIDDSANLLSTDTVCGALRYSIEKILTAFPKIKIFVSLPLYRTWNGEGAETHKNSLEKTLPEYDSAMKTVAEDYNLPTIDGYKRLGVNSINSSSYLSDGTHLNNFGRKQFGEFIGGCLICGA